MTNKQDRAGSEGFTLLEILVVMSITAILMTIGAFALRQYWLTHALHGSRDEVVSQLRRQQERAVAESNPLAYGVRVRPGSNSWDLIVFNGGASPGPEDDTCRAFSDAGALVTTIGHQSLSTGVIAQAASFMPASGVTSVCQAQLSGAGSDQFAIFFARGTATQGSITFTHGSLPDRSVGLTVSPITGRVEATG